MPDAADATPGPAEAVRVHAYLRRVRGVRAHEVLRSGWVAGAIGEARARELLDVLTRTGADRAALIGRLAVRDDAAWQPAVGNREVDEPAVAPGWTKVRLDRPSGGV